MIREKAGWERKRKRYRIGKVKSGIETKMKRTTNDNAVRLMTKAATLNELIKAA